MQYAPEEITVETIQRLGIITLNRPKQLNALNRNMVKNLKNHLAFFENANEIQAILIKSAEGRAFCAGGDIRLMYDAHLEKHPDITQFFKEEYALNQLVKACRKPYIALMDGITMGGGAGISIHGKYRIATERLVFAMPEAGIGFFPDVGATYFLSRLSGRTGIYLGLTGARINCHDAYYAKLIDVIIKSCDSSVFINKLIKQANLTQDIIESTFLALQQLPEPSTLEKNQALIDDCFSADSVEEIIERLAAYKTPFARETADLLERQSPLSLKITLAALKKAVNQDFNQCMEMESCLASHFVKNPNYYEGIRAAIIDKDRKPRWQPAELNQIDNKMIEEYFTNID